MLKSFTTKSDQDKPLAEVEDDKGIEKYYFKNECECFITISKHEKTDESKGPLRPSAFIVFECLEIVMKRDARVFEMTSLKKQYKIM